MPSAILTKDEFSSLKKMIKKVPERIIQKKLNKGKTFGDFKTVIQSKKFSKKRIIEFIPFLDEELRTYLPLRLDKTFTIATKHVRR